MERSPEGSPERKKEEYIILEIGSGTIPYIADPDLSKEYRERFQSDDSIRYIGIDYDEDELKYGKRFQNTLRKDLNLTGRVHYVAATGKQLPFRDESVSEVILKNVLGDPDATDIRSTIHEVARVLKRGSILKVIEQYTPEVSFDRRDRAPYLMVLKGVFELIHDPKETGFVDETSIDEVMTGDRLSRRQAGAFVLRFKKK